MSPWLTGNNHISGPHASRVCQPAPNLVCIGLLTSRAWLLHGSGQASRGREQAAAGASVREVGRPLLLPTTRKDGAADHAGG